MRCPSCSAENQAGKRFCRKCGRPLTLACPTCGVTVEADDTFCGECGSALAVSESAGTLGAPMTHSAVAWVEL